MAKEFDSWNSLKKSTDARSGKLYHEREIWWCRLGVNIGFEQDGTGTSYDRPVLILRGMSRRTCFVIPLSTSLTIHPLRLPIGVIDSRTAVALISQLRLIDTRRLINKITYLDAGIFETVRKAAKAML